jgi:homoserine/homoserine lactone efflux protein
LGASTIRRSFTSASVPEAPDSSAPSRAPFSRSSSRPFWRGFVSQGANPNLLIYFTAILPQFIDSTLPVTPQLVILACSSFVIEFSVLAAYSGLSGRAGRAAAPRFRAYLERVGGTLLIGAAVGLARIERE